MMEQLDFQPLPGRESTHRVVAFGQSSAVVGYVRQTPRGFFIARTVGNALEAADVRRFPTRDGAARWLLSSGQRRAA